MRPSDNWTKWLAGFAAVLLTDCVPFEERERERERKAGREREREDGSFCPEVSLADLLTVVLLSRYSRPVHTWRGAPSRERVSLAFACHQFTACL